MTEPSFTLGIEEEYLLVDIATRQLASAPPAELFADCEAALKGRVSPEFLKCQIEVGTPVCASIQAARDELAFLRQTIADKARPYGLAPIAASTHPFADWMEQPHTDRERYNTIAQDMQVVAERLLICGMHVHVGIEDAALRFDLFSQIPYFLPHLLALSTSSPFWQGRNTGLKSYRIGVFNELPRTGLPDRFESEASYRQTVDMLVHAGVIEDATKIWWDLRPSERFPTLEMRITDLCTRIDDTVALAALYRCLCRFLTRLRSENRSWRSYAPLLLEENRWLAQRYGTDAELIDFARAERFPLAELVRELTDMVAPDAKALNCEAEIAYLSEIVRNGTSADRQLAVYHQALKHDNDEHKALDAVVDHLIAETIAL
ncbi:carboxylate-amine ligase [Roseibium sp.]|uniref:carboxylate-amine ligase n=1 Tax=Roseibium sp. TaxID=1936156 RepID=UPI003A97433E